MAKMRKRKQGAAVKKTAQIHCCCLKEIRPDCCIVVSRSITEREYCIGKEGDTVLFKQSDERGVFMRVKLLADGIEVMGVGPYGMGALQILPEVANNVTIKYRRWGDDE